MVALSRRGRAANGVTPILTPFRLTVAHGVRTFHVKRTECSLSSARWRFCTSGGSAERPAAGRTQLKDVSIARLRPEGFAMLTTLVLGRAIAANIRLDRAHNSWRRPAPDGFSWLRAFFG
jgi:hypothetical protein